MKVDKIFEMLEKRKESITQVANWTTYEKFVSHVELYLTKNYADLQDIESDKSIVDCIIDAAKIGVFVDGRNSILQPANIKNKQTGQYYKGCRLSIIYKGMRTVARRHLPIKDIYAEVVCENDYFDYQLGDNPAIVHKPTLDGERGSFVYCYSITKLKDGTVLREVMSEKEVKQCKAMSKDSTGNYSPWVNFPAQQWKKTVMRRQLDKLLDDVDNEALKTMLNIDNEGYELTAQPAGNPLDEFEEKPKKKKKKSQEKEAIEHAERQYNRAKADKNDSGIDHEKLDEFLETDIIYEPPGEGADAEDLQPKIKTKSVLPFDKPVPEISSLSPAILKILSSNDKIHPQSEKFAKAIKSYCKNKKIKSLQSAYDEMLQNYEVQEFSEFSEAEINKYF